ncbi:hypothetical protein DVH24_014412 [Malus domestica]|uniref:Uncharacterized protein n=1 Tax=Malus domestica TaxID=3750 RepID=A0A498KK61_MALDO|nr:hypothetical protein DVH24_014412 [Malus domestica]
MGLSLRTAEAIFRDYSARRTDTMSPPAMVKMEDAKPKVSASNVRILRAAILFLWIYMVLITEGIVIGQELLQASYKFVQRNQDLLISNASAIGNGTTCIVITPFYSHINNIFFNEFALFVVKAGSILSNIYGVNWENKLEANFVYLSLLSSFSNFNSHSDLDTFSSLKSFFVLFFSKHDQIHKASKYVIEVYIVHVCIALYMCECGYVLFWVDLVNEVCFNFRLIWFLLNKSNVISVNQLCLKIVGFSFFFICALLVV